MIRNRSNDEIQSSAKRLKPNEEEADNQDKMAALDATDGAEEQNIANANDGPSPSIFKLDIDCCEEVFAFLSLADLHSLGQTCKRMHQFTGYFVRENYKSTQFRWMNGNLYFNESKMNGFIELISYMQIESNQLERFKEFAPRFKSVKKLSLFLYDDKIDCIKEILNKCEVIDILFDHNVLNIDLYENILKFCTNLKYFSLNSAYDIVLKNNNWLLHEYPKLGSLDLYSASFSMQTIAEIRTFFTLNKGIRKFQTNFVCLWDFRHWILDTDIKLDELLVDCEIISLIGLNREHINLLNTLYERGFYKHLSLLKVLRYDSSILAKIRAPLTMEIFGDFSSLPPLNLKELRVNRYIMNTARLETFLANNVLNIERIHFPCLNTVNVLFFIRKFMKLREIKISFLDDVNSFNLATLNEERKKLDGAKSVTIYLSKTQFNQIIKISNLELVKVKCI